MDDSSSDDNLFDVGEWNHAKSVFEDDEKEQCNVVIRTRRINSVSHTVNKSYSQQKRDSINLALALKHEMELTNASITQTNNSQTTPKYLPYSYDNNNINNPPYYDENALQSTKRQMKPKIIPQIKASKSQLFKNNICSHALGSDMLLNDIIDEMAGNNTTSQPLAEPGHYQYEQNEGVTDSLVKYVNGIYDRNKKQSQIFTDCTSIQTCDSLKRIISCLNFYDNIMGETAHKDVNGVINEYFCNYAQFLNDYYHILAKHLNGGGTIENEKTFEQIYYKLCKYIQCNILTCNSYLRGNNENIDVNVEFYIDVLDSIHCLLLHSFDAGYRINTNQLMQFTTMINANTYKNKCNSFNNDKQLKHLQLYLLAKRRQLWLMKGNDFMKMNKFNNSLQTNRKQNRFGQKFYFWEYFKDNNQRDTVHNPLYKYSDWYIHKKYSSLKHEILNNKNGYKLNHKQYKKSHLKAVNYMNTIYVKKMIKTENNFENYLMKKKLFQQQNIWDLSRYYSINDDDIISVQHILALILYVDYVKLAYFYRNSFYLLEKETENDFKQRKREYWHLTKLITECIEIYGEWISHSKYDTFYTGICNKVLWHQLYPNFVAQISVTTQLCVASMYCDNNNGYILELTTNSCSSPLSLFVKHFNCNFLSSFAYESEIIIGECIDMRSLRISCIRSIKHYENYYCFIRAMNMFDKVLNGQRIYLFNDKTPQMDYKIINKLIARKIGKNKNEYPKYVNDIFCAIINNKKCITLNIYDINTIYYKLREYFISYSTSTMRDNGICDIVLFENLCNLCPFVDIITVKMSNERNIMSQYVLNILHTTISSMGHSRLQLIKLTNVANKCNEKVIKIFKKNINAINWDITILAMNQKKYKNQYQFIIFKQQKTANLATKFKNVFSPKLQLP